MKHLENVTSHTVTRPWKPDGAAVRGCGFVSLTCPVFTNLITFPGLVFFFIENVFPRPQILLLYILTIASRNGLCAGLGFTIDRIPIINKLSLSHRHRDQRFSDVVLLSKTEFGKVENKPWKVCFHPPRTECDHQCRSKVCYVLTDIFIGTVPFYSQPPGLTLGFFCD